MPNSLRDEEVSAVYGALDNDAFGAGDHIHAHVLRELKRQAKHVAVTGNYLVHQVWRVDGSDDLEPTGGCVFDVMPQWARVLGPFFPPRKPNLQTGELQVYARITSGATVLLQIVTGRHALRADVRSSGARNVLAMVGSGSWEWYELTGVALGLDAHDVIEVWATADAASGFDTAAFGTPATGTPSTVSPGELYVATAAWNANAINAAPGRNVVRFLNADGAIIAPDRPVIASDATHLGLLPNLLTGDQAQACTNAGVTFALRTQPAVRLGAFVLVEEHGY